MNNRILLIITFLFFAHLSKSQNQQPTSAFGKVDTADLRMTECDFEKDAKALILFDKADITACMDSVVIIHHKRLKLFMDYDKDLATIRLPYYSYQKFEKITSIEAQTIRLENNTIVITKLDPKQIYIDTVDKHRKVIVFTFPGIKPGCVIEYKYKWKTSSPANMPPWFFQATIPTRYSELNVTTLSVHYKSIMKGNQPFVIDTIEDISTKKDYYKLKRCMAKANIHSFIIEPFMTTGNMNLQYISFQLNGLANGYLLRMATNNTWMGIASRLMEDEDFGLQLSHNIANQDVLIKHADSLKTVDQKIAYLFAEVKKTMSWNKIDLWYTRDGIRKAWSKKTGNSTEINLILCHLLIKAGIKANPMVVSTRSNEPIDPKYASFSQLNKTVAYIYIDSTKNYVLDASGKYNIYNEIPAELLNTYSIEINLAKRAEFVYQMTFLENNKPALNIIFINADIKPNSKIDGTTVISNYSYSKASYQRMYNDLDHNKYLDFLGGSNNLKISNLVVENMEVDNLPLIQRFNFNMELSESDNEYIYFNPNLFTPLQTNPFINAVRYSDIDFGNCNTYRIFAKYKLPPGYKIDALPKNIALYSYDKSIVLQRIIEVNADIITLSYVFNYNRSTYSVDEYAQLRDYYKKMFETLNEPVVLKKAL